MGIARSTRYSALEVVYPFFKDHCGGNLIMSRKAEGVFESRIRQHCHRRLPCYASRLTVTQHTGLKVEWFVISLAFSVPGANLPVNPPIKVKLTHNRTPRSAITSPNHVKHPDREPA